MTICQDLSAPWWKKLFRRRHCLHRDGYKWVTIDHGSGSGARR